MGREDSAPMHLVRRQTAGVARGRMKLANGKAQEFITRGPFLRVE